jgi:hypothetical protein
VAVYGLDRSSDSVFASNLRPQCVSPTSHLGAARKSNCGGQSFGSETPGRNWPRTDSKLEHPLSPERLIREYRHHDRRQAGAQSGSGNARPSVVHDG